MKKLKVGYLAENFGSVSDSFYLDTEQIMQQTGHNTGNLAFWFAAHRLFNANKVLFGWETNPNELKEKVDLLFFPAANFLIEGSNLQKLANIIKEVNVPCIIVGLGAQSEDETKIPILSEGTLNFLDEISKRTPYLYLRGQYTQKVCNHYRITNTKVVGCPSILINNDRKLGHIIENSLKKKISSVSVHAACMKETLKKTERELYKISDLYNGKYIIQRPPELISILNSEGLSEQQLNYATKFAKFVFPDHTYAEFTKHFMCSSEYYIDANSWINSLRKYSHSIGTRIHGTILSTSAYIPSVCITHDTRTRELVKRLLIPSISSTEFNVKSDSLESIFHGIQFSGDNFEENRTEISNEYKELFKQLELQYSELLETF